MCWCCNCWFDATSLVRTSGDLLAHDSSTVVRYHSYINSLCVYHYYFSFIIVPVLVPLVEDFWSYDYIEFSCFYIAGQSSQRHYCAITVGEDAVVSAYRWVPLLTDFCVSDWGDHDTSSDMVTLFFSPFIVSSVDMVYWFKLYCKFATGNLLW